MVGGGYFTCNEHECIYSVGAYKRELFDEPLGHCIQDKAISIMINKNIPWYKIGERPYPADYSSPSEKEISIGVFKEGFASHIIPVLLIESGAGEK